MWRRNGAMPLQGNVRVNKQQSIRIIMSTIIKALLKTVVLTFAV